MQQILKRLELIKTSIAIEDEEIIELQVAKLLTLPIDDTVQNILNQLSNNNYGNAVVEIESYIARYSGVVVYDDKELGGLKLELKVLEAKLQDLSEERNEYLNDIHEFNIQYNLHLGEIIRKILKLKKEILFKLKNDETISDDDDIHGEYEEAKAAFEEFDREYEEIINKERFDLDKDDLLELKKAYRKASKLCHPDIVPDELKIQALKLMQELNEAYSKKDLKKVKEILSMLENGNGFEVASDSINDKQLLKSKIEDIRSKIDEVINEIDEIKSDETFTTIQELDDWDDYFEVLKINLTEEQERLEEQRQKIEQEKSSQSDNVKNINIVEKDSSLENDDYWNEAF